MPSSYCSLQIFTLLFCFIGSTIERMRPPPLLNLNDLHNITLTAGQNTTTFHYTPRPQLTCILSNTCHLVPITSVTCYIEALKNNGAISWKCHKPQPGNFSESLYQFQVKAIFCEHYPAPGDQDIVIGSCALEYAISRKPLILTVIGSTFLGISILLLTFTIVYSYFCDANFERKDGEVSGR